MMVVIAVVSSFGTERKEENVRTAGNGTNLPVNEHLIPGA